MPLPSFTTSAERRALAGVCAGIADALGVEVTLVGVVSALLALAGGAGIVLYLALWAWARTRREWWPILLLAVAGALLLGAVGVSDRAVAGIVLVAAGLTLAWRRGGSFRPDAPLSYAGLVLAAGGAVVLLGQGSAPTRVLAPGAVGGALLLVGGPWLWPAPPPRVAALSGAAADVEELYGVRVELASSGDAPPAGALVLAAREAMTNAAKFAGVEEVDVYAEVTDDEIAIFVRDRGAGFDPAAVPEDRKGIADSIESRLARAGGTA